MNGDLGPASVTADRDVYARLIAELDASGARYRLIEHVPEGRTEVVSALLEARDSFVQRHSFETTEPVLFFEDHEQLSNIGIGQPGQCVLCPVALLQRLIDAKRIHTRRPKCNADKARS